MSKRIISLRKVTKGDATHLKIELYYSKGGMNYFSASSEPRGIYLSVTPVRRSISDKLVSESYTAFSGVKLCVKEMARFNQKAFDTFEVDNDTKIKLIAHVITKNNLELEPLAE